VQLTPRKFGGLVRPAKEYVETMKSQLTHAEVIQIMRYTGSVFCYNH
jgi:hypothetical protein